MLSVSYIVYKKIFALTMQCKHAGTVQLPLTWQQVFSACGKISSQSLYICPKITDSLVIHVIYSI